MAAAKNIPLSLAWRRFALHEREKEEKKKRKKKSVMAAKLRSLQHLPLASHITRSAAIAGGDMLR